MSREGERKQVICKGNRTQVTMLTRGGRTIVQKRLLGFADVSTERVALYYEGLVQRGARGPGVVAIVAKGVAAGRALRSPAGSGSMGETTEETSCASSGPP